MSILTFVEVACFWGIALYLLNRFLPMSAEIKRLLNVGVVVLLALWLLFSILHGVPDVTVTAR